MSDRKSSKRRKDSTSSESSVDSTENERRKDLLERDEFANRLRKKDETHTRKVTEVSLFNASLPSTNSFQVFHNRTEIMVQFVKISLEIRVPKHNLETKFKLNVSQTVCFDFIFLLGHR